MTPRKYLQQYNITMMEIENERKRKLCIQQQQEKEMLQNKKRKMSKEDKKIEERAEMRDKFLCFLEKEKEEKKEEKTGPTPPH